MQQETVTLIVAGLGIAGTLGGIVVGHFLTKSWQREQWLLDNRRDEFRELVSALTATIVAAISYTHARSLDSLRAPQLLNRIAECQDTAYNVIGSRIYIAKDVEALNVMPRYMKLLHGLLASQGVTEATHGIQGLLDEIVKIAQNG